MAHSGNSADVRLHSLVRFNHALSCEFKRALLPWAAFYHRINQGPDRSFRLFGLNRIKENKVSRSFDVTPFSDVRPVN